MMSMLCCRCSCERRCGCTLVAIIASVILGVVAAFLQFAGTITVTPAFLWVALGIAVGYLAVLVLGVALAGGRELCGCVCSVLQALLVGILGTALLAVVLLAIGIVATSILSAVLIGALVLTLSLTLTETGCLVLCLADCSE